MEHAEDNPYVTSHTPFDGKSGAGLLGDVSTANAAEADAAQLHHHHKHFELFNKYNNSIYGILKRVVKSQLNYINGSDGVHVTPEEVRLCLCHCLCLCIYLCHCLCLCHRRCLCHCLFVVFLCVQKGIFYHAFPYTTRRRIVMSQFMKFFLFFSL